MIKILRPFTATGAVFFPIGKPPGGTCEFASLQCKKYCYAALPEYPDFDEEIRITESDKLEIYKLFMTAPDITWLREEILRELDGLQTPILHWFGSGDCPTKDISRISDIIDSLKYDNIIQMGFTRNEALWEQHKAIFALSVDSEDQINGRAGLFSVADYKKGTSYMYNSNKPTRGGVCGPELCLDRMEHQLAHFINCRTCMRLKTGCFDFNRKVK